MQPEQAPPGAKPRKPRKPPRRGNKRQPTPKKAAIAARAEELRAKVWALRLQGHAVRAIAQQLGCGVATAMRAINSTLDELQAARHEAAREAIALGLERLDSALVAVTPLVQQGDLEAVDRLVKIEARRAKMLGVDAPDRTEVSGPEGAPIAVEAKTSLAAKLDALAQRLAGPQPS